MEGDVEYGSLMAGQVAAMGIKKNRAKEIIDDIILGAEKY